MLGISKGKSVSSKKAERFHQVIDTKSQSGRDLYPIAAVTLVALVAIGLRIAFSYSASSNSNFSLSGGINSSEHLRKITEIITGKSFFGADDLNYPFVSYNAYPTLFDVVMVPFVIAGKIMGLAVPTSASMVLAWSGAIFGVLCTIFAYFLGKEVLESKKAGFLTSLFIALCPISIAQSTLSYGAETPFLAFLFTVFVYFVFKCIKIYDNSSKYPSFLSIFKKNKKSLKYAIYSGFTLSIFALSWSAFRPVFITTIFCMIILVLVDRLTGNDSRVPALFFSIMLFTAVIVSESYCLLTGLWIPTSTGIFILSIFSAIMCLAFSFAQNRSCLFTIPIFTILITAIFTALYHLEPTTFYSIVNGTISGEMCDITTIRSYLSLSKIAVFFGPATMWFPFIVIGIMLCGIRKGITSSLYVCTIVLLCFTIGFAIQKAELAAIFAPMFAVSFAYIIVWLFAHVNFQSYFKSLNSERISLVIRRIFKPIPFLSIFVILVTICAPNALYAIDASVPNSNEYNGISLGALDYNTKTDDEWKKNSVLLEYNDTQKSGSMATWIDHINEATAFGNFNVTVDLNGNGAISTSNIFLSKSPAAAMLLHSIKCNGFAESKNILLTSGMTEDQFIKIKQCFDSPDEKFVKDVYHDIKADVLDESISYLTAENILMDNFSEQELSKLYRKLYDAYGGNIEYIMVTNDMFPMYIDHSSSFAALANASGYVVNDKGTIPRFFDINSVSHSTEIYNYTDTMYDTALWKSYIGMSPKEIGKTPYDYLTALMLSNGTYKATPGYGLFNYTVDYAHWYVMYNSNPNATLSSSGWIKMLATAAQEKQIIEGGLINYLSGFPVILKYIHDSDLEHIISGRIEMSDVPAKGIYVAVMDENKTIHSYDYTDADGNYEVTARENQKIIFATSRSAFDAGNLIFAKTYNVVSDNPNIIIPATSLSGKIIGSNDEPLKISSPLRITFTGRNTDNILSTIPDCNAKFSFESIVPGTYDITITNENGNNICDPQSYTVIAGAKNKDVNVKIATCRVTINTINDAGTTISGDTIVMTEKCGTKFEGTSTNGIAIIDVIPGAYTYSAKDKIVTLPMSVISDDTFITARLHNSKEVTINGLDNGTAIIYSKGYLQLCTGNKAYVPIGSGSTAKYTFYSITESGVCLSNIDKDTDELDLSSLSEPAVEVSGILMNGSNKVIGGGTIVFIKDEMEVPVSSDSRGFYKVLLPKGTYSIYANYCSDVKIIKEFVSVELKDIKDKNIQLSNGMKISGHTYWSEQSPSTTLSYIPIRVSSISGVEGVSFTILSGPDGSYSFYIPCYSTCTLTGFINADDSNYYYNDLVGITKKEILGVNSEENLIANIKEVKINEISVNANIDAIKTVKDPVRKEASIPVLTTEIIPSSHSILTLTGITDKDKVTIKTLDGSTIQHTTTKGTQYIVENNKQFAVIVKTPKSGSVYKVIELSRDATFNVSDFRKYDLFDINGYVGISKPGILKVLSYNEEEQRESQCNIDSSGKYSISLPVSYKHKLYAHIPFEDKDKLIHYIYSGQRELDEDFEPEKTYTRNLSVTSQEYRSDDITISDIAIEKMTDNVKSKIDFNFVITNNTGEDTTLLMRAGSGWEHLTFYSCDEFGKCADNQISSITIDKSAKVHAIGIIDKNTAGLGTDNLSINITDTKNNTVCIGILDCNSNWHRTENNTSLVGYGLSAITSQEYQCSIKIQNCDNFEKEYKIKINGLGNTWFKTLANGNKICNMDDNIVIHGYEEATICAKIIPVNQEDNKDGETIRNISITVLRQNETFSTNTDADKIEITNNCVVLKPVKQLIEIRKASASEGIWPYIWPLIGIVTLIVLLKWSSIKEMLSRRK